MDGAHFLTHETLAKPVFVSILFTNFIGGTGMFYFIGGTAEYHSKLQLPIDHCNSVTVSGHPT